MTRDRLAGALKAARVGTWQWDKRSESVVWDQVLEELYSLPEGGFGGRFEDWIALVHPDDRDRVVAAVQQSVEDRADHHIEHRLQLPDGGVRWVECRGKVVLDGAGEVVGMTGISLDVTERRAMQDRQDRLQAERERARQRLAFLAEASDVLARSLDVEASLDELANLVVPRLANWCVVNLLDAGRLRVATIAHADPAKVEAAQRLLERYGRPDEQASHKVLRTGRPEVLNDIDNTVLEDIATDSEHLDLLRGLGLRFAVIVPMQARGMMLGTLALVRSADSDPFGDDDITLARDLARRASVALDNARLFDEQRRLAAALQQTLLPPELPPVPGVSLAARYQPASLGSAIGGDFYDVFDNGHGSWTVLIGDVRGKGPEAASLTGLSRHSVRAAALRDPDPVQVLSVLNDALIRHDPYESFCTATCGRLEVSDDRVALAIAGGGHPPALHLRRGGEVNELPSSGTLLGLFADPGCRTTTIELEVGDTLLLYTDGITEARRGDEQYGLARLCAVLAESVGCKPDEIADRVLQAVRGFQDDHHRGDDVAVLALGRDAPT